MLYGAQVAVCSEKNTKEISQVWAKYQVLICKPVNHIANHET